MLVSPQEPAKRSAWGERRPREFINCVTFNELFES